MEHHVLHIGFPVCKYNRFVIRAANREAVRGKGPMVDDKQDIHLVYRECSLLSENCIPNAQSTLLQSLSLSLHQSHNNANNPLWILYGPTGFICVCVILTANHR